jgi:hypothetical protein
MLETCCAATGDGVTRKTVQHTAHNQACTSTVVPPTPHLQCESVTRQQGASLWPNGCVALHGTVRSERVSVGLAAVCAA